MSSPKITKTNKVIFAKFKTTSLQKTKS